MIHVLWVTTFRDFNGSYNDQLQLNFINSIKNLHNVKVDIYTTIFHEKNVRETLLKNYKNIFFKNSSKAIKKNQVLSHSISMRNALKHYLKNYDKYDAFVWSTMDILVPSNFFDFILKNNVDNKFLFTSHPNHEIRSNNSINIRNSESGADIFVFYNLSRDEITKIISLEKEFPNIDYGLYEHALIAFAQIINLPSFNIYSESKILKQPNMKLDIEEQKKRRLWILKGAAKNQETYLRMCKKYNISKYYFMNMSYCLVNLKNTKFSIIFYIRLFYGLIKLFLKSFYKKYILKLNIDLFEINEKI